MASSKATSDAATEATSSLPVQYDVKSHSQISIATSTTSTTVSEAPSLLLGPNSRGVRRMQIIRTVLTRSDRCRIFVSMFLFAFTYSLGDLLRSSFQAESIARFPHQTAAVTRVLPGIIAAPIYFLVAKVADAFGRVELVGASVLTYILGAVLDATPKDIYCYYAGLVISQIGLSAILLLVEVIVADLTALKNRLFFSVLPLWPSLVNVWISPQISDAVTERIGWQWGIAMWAFFVPAMSIPLIVSLWLPYRRAVREQRLKDHPSALQNRGLAGVVTALLSELAFVTVVLVAATLALVLVTFAIASDSFHLADQWRQPRILIPFLTGAICLPLILTLWENKVAKYRPLPLHLLKKRAVWSPLGAAGMLGCCWAIQAHFLYTVIVVAYDFQWSATISATQIMSLYLFSSVVTSVSVGCLVMYFRRLKLFIVLGSIVMAGAQGLLIHSMEFSSSSLRDIIGAQILVGISWGLMLEPGKALIQAATTNEYLAVMTALFMAMHALGLSIGYAVSGAMWTQILQLTLRHNLPHPFNDSTTVEDIFRYPFLYAYDNPRNTSLRVAMIESFCHGQKMLTVTSTCLCVLLILFAVSMNDPELGDDQNIAGPEDIELRVARET